MGEGGSEHSPVQRRCSSYPGSRTSPPRRPGPRPRTPAWAGRSSCRPTTRRSGSPAITPSFELLLQPFAAVLGAPGRAVGAPRARRAVAAGRGAGLLPGDRSRCRTAAGREPLHLRPRVGPLAGPAAPGRAARDAPEQGVTAGQARPRHFTLPRPPLGQINQAVLDRLRRPLAPTLPGDAHWPVGRRCGDSFPAGDTGDSGDRYLSPTASLALRVARGCRRAR